ncbi:LacI family DNA-binding transcriptional regulator [Janthinobacterium sp. PSPC3-1]|uniref:LacI family DNA-binding transcriptional regulator n=1 Tax=Janthinobacterium sp. PSPC3-1 TaxID=2804653 RepID=UPI003CFA92D5
MNKRPTMTSVAQAAGVSVATVDRVLNSRLPVKDGTADRVVLAAQKIGYHATELMRRRLLERAPLLTLGFCLQKQDDPFYQDLAAALREAAEQHAGLRCEARVEFMDQLVPRLIAERIHAVGMDVDALAVVALDHPYVNEAINALRALGKPVFTLLSDVSSPLRSAYLGIDNRKAGRTAAWAIARMAPRAGEVGILIGSQRYLGQESRESGFRSYFREHAPDFRVLEAHTNLEDQDLSQETVLDLLAAHPQMVGLCVAGGGSAGVVRALREEMPAQGLVVVVNELVPVTRSALIDGIVDLVIATPQQRLAQAAVRAMALSCDEHGSSLAVPEPLSFDLHTAESV